MPDNTTTDPDDRRRRVVLATGETLPVAYDDHRGVHTDAGCHPWDTVEAFRLWSPRLRRWVSVPIH